MTDVRIGTSGWNYPTGRGTWNGVFYPLPRRRPKGFDELSYYAEHFDTVEVNSTFYGQPREDVCRRWASRTPQPGGPRRVPARRGAARGGRKTGRASRAVSAELQRRTGLGRLFGGAAARFRRTPGRGGVAP